MKTCAMSMVVFLWTALAARAHFIWIVPDGPEGTRAKVVFSEGLEPDDAVPIDKIAATSLQVRDSADQTTAVRWEKLDQAYVVSLPKTGSLVCGGTCWYGVLQRGESKPFLLAYHPKLVRGDIDGGKPWDQLPLEIVRQQNGKLRVLFAGKPTADTEVVALGASTAPLKADEQGEFQLSATAPGLYGIRARFIEPRAGEHEGKKYTEIRHYATLVFRVGPAPATGTKETSARSPAALPDFAPLPRAVSSFGAAVADGWLYVYGGHCVRTHQYSTESVTGSFQRLKLSNPKGWEELLAGPALQGLAVVAHRGKVYRIGGMQPRNAPGEPADNHSVASCARFDPSTRIWEPLPDLPEGRSSHDAVVAGDKLVVVGGWKMNGAGEKSAWADTTLVLDLEQQPQKWQVVKQPFQRRALTAAVYQGKVYVIGGMTPAGSTELTVNIFDPESHRWTTGPELPGPARNGFSPAAVEAGDKLYVNPADGRLFRLAHKGDGWEEVGRLAIPRIVHRLVAASNEVLVAVGGASKSGNVAVTEAVRPQQSP